MADKPLKDSIALITGGGRGIGAGIARRLAELGPTTLVPGPDPKTRDKPRVPIRAAGGACEALPCDIRDLGSVEKLAAQVQTRHGRLDILVNNAGVADFSTPLHKLAPEKWEAILNTNLRGVYYCMRAFVPMMLRAGRGDIVNISSTASQNALPNGAAYAASKWGLKGLSVSAAEELRGHNIRVMLVSPGSTVSELSPHAGRDPNKMLQPEDVAHVVAMLLTQSPRSFASEVLLRPTQKP